MKKLYALLVLVLILFGGTIYSATYTIVNVGDNFSPDSITISTGDKVTFSISSMHNAVEVNKDVWDANGTTSNGGFSVPYGGGSVTFNTAGTYYYVCQAHAYLGMKGKIIVLLATNVPGTQTENGINLNTYPNPATSFLNVDFSVSQSGRIKIDLIDMTGRVVSNFLDAEYDQGNYNITLSLANYSEGRYFVRYSYGNGFSVKPIIIERLRIRR